MSSRRLARSFATLTVTVLASSGAAFAAPVTVGAISFSPAFQKALADDYGSREGERLAAEVRKRLERDLAGVEAPAPTRVDVEIVDAKPNRPTMQQMTDTPGLSMASIGIGGASLRATLRDASGAEQRTVSYDWYENDIRDVMAASTWTDADRAIRWFSAQVKEAASGAPERPGS